MRSRRSMATDSAMTQRHRRRYHLISDSYNWRRLSGHPPLSTSPRRWGLRPVGGSAESCSRARRLTGTQAPSLQRLLISLTSLGILADADDRFGLTALGAALRTGAPGSARAVILLMARDRPAALGAVKASQTALLAGRSTGDAAADRPTLRPSRAPSSALRWSSSAACFPPERISSSRARSMARSTARATM